MASPNLNAFLAAILKQVQLAEDALFAVIASRFLGTAVRQQLDAIGRLVGSDRLGRAYTDDGDNEYRAAIRLQIYINGSSGRPEDLIFVGRQLTGQAIVKYLDVTAANCRLVIPGWTPDTGALLAFLQKICPAGVRLIDVTPNDTYLPKRMGERMGTRFSHL